MEHPILTTLVTFLGIVPFILRVSALITGIENTYIMQNIDVKKVEKEYHKKRIVMQRSRTRKIMTGITLLYMVVAVELTFIINNIINGGLMKNNTKGLIAVGAGLAALALITIVSIFDFNDAKNENNRLKRKKQVKNKQTDKIHKPVYAEVKIPRPLDASTERVESIPKSDVINVGDTSVINIAKLGLTETASREPFFKKSDAADKFIAAVKELYKGQEGQMV